MYRIQACALWLKHGQNQIECSIKSYNISLKGQHLPELWVYERVSVDSGHCLFIILCSIVIIWLLLCLLCMLYPGGASFTWIGNYIHNEEWDEIIYPFPNFKGTIIEVWEWINDFIPLLTGHVITYPCWGWSQSIIVKGVSCWNQ